MMIGALLCTSTAAYAEESVNVPMTVFSSLYRHAAEKCEGTNDRADQEALFSIMKRNKWCVSPTDAHQVAKCPR
jgi:hypothetical protein